MTTPETPGGKATSSDPAAVQALEAERDLLRSDHEEALAAMRELRDANASLQAQVRDLSTSVEEAIAARHRDAGKTYVRFFHWPFFFFFFFLSSKFYVGLCF
jgi:hypothetical protein